jgi:hypothetical protein
MIFFLYYSQNSIEFCFFQEIILAMNKVWNQAGNTNVRIQVTKKLYSLLCLQWNESIMSWHCLSVCPSKSKGSTFFNSVFTNRHLMSKASKERPSCKIGLWHGSKNKVKVKVKVNLIWPVIDYNHYYKVSVFIYCYIYLVSTNFLYPWNSVKPK